MFVYWGTRFDAVQAGKRVVGVKCDKCGCEYFYVLARTGVGAGSAPYGIGAGSAQGAGRP